MWRKTWLFFNLLYFFLNSHLYNLHLFSLVFNNSGVTPANLTWRNNYYYNMIFLRNIVAASILLVLISTPAVVEGSCTCTNVIVLTALYGSCNAFCVCNIFGCNCDGCEAVPGAYGWTRHMMDAWQGERGRLCRFPFFDPSWQKASKRNLLACKYCDDDQVVCKDIYEVLLSLALSKFEGVVLSDVVSYIQLAGGIDNVLICELFNKSYGDVSHLTLCDDKHLVLPASNKTGKKQKKN